MEPDCSCDVVDSMWGSYYPSYIDKNIYGDDYYNRWEFSILDDLEQVQRTQTKEKQMSGQKFWMVTGDKNAPRVRHDSFRKAEDEAQRLAKQNPGIQFFVVEAVAGYELPQPGLKRVL